MISSAVVRARHIFALVALQLLAVAIRSPAQTDGGIDYRFSYSRPGDVVRVEMTWKTPLAEAKAMIMPRGIPMGYGEQRYDAFLAVVEGTAAGSGLLQREEGPPWRVPAGATGVRYEVNLRRMEAEVTGASDSSRVRDGYLSALGYSVFAYIEGFETRPVGLRIQGPPEWPVFSTLAPRVPAEPAAIDAAARDFYALADGQVIMGPRATFRRLADKPAPLYLAAYAEGPVDLDRLGRLAVTAYQRVNDYFGTTPFAHYTIQQELLTPISPAHEYGMSMEHLDSSTYYLAASTGLTSSSTAEDEARVLYNFAHHIAHAWVPKRAYSRGYFPFQWELAPVLDSIWFAEGFGQYAAIIAVAEGTPDPAAFREGMLARRFRTNVASAPPFLKQMSLVELSRVGSTRYSEDFRVGRLLFSRGGLMAAAMDDRIRAGSKGSRSLRDAFRYLVAWSARERRAFEIEELPDLIQQATGVDTRGIMEEWMK
jgi:predicted metalloprotease with PDZ domain